MKILAKDIEFSGGRIRLNGDYLIEGRVDGTIESDGCIVVGPNAFVTGELMAESVVVHGKVVGQITTGATCELRSTSTVVGGVSASHLRLEDGADFTGDSRVGRYPLDLILADLTERFATQAA